jgi:hypothetical protein
MRKKLRLTTALLVATTLALGTPAYAELNQAETAVKQKLEQKLQDGTITSQELDVYRLLLNKENQTSDFAKSYQESTGHVMGWGTGLLLVGGTALVLCLAGVLPACPLIAAAGGG